MSSSGSFQRMDKARQKEIASQGGRASHQKGTAHEFDSAEARAAGRKGGLETSKNREHMRAIGRKGGLARKEKAKRARESSPLPVAITEVESLPIH